MAERLLVARLRAAIGTDIQEEIFISHGAGTGDWHVGEFMDPAAARQIQRLGGDPTGFSARTLASDQIARSHLILTATTTHAKRVVAIEPSAEPRTFLLREFAELVQKVDLELLPPFAPNSKALLTRGQALVAAADAIRSDRLFNSIYDVDDPWGRDDKYFAEVADEIDAAVNAIAAALVAEDS